MRKGYRDALRNYLEDGTREIRFSKAFMKSEEADIKLNRVVRVVIEYDHRTNDWIVHLDRLEHHFSVYEIVDDSKKKNYLLPWIGDEGLTLINNLIPEGKLDSLSFE